MKILIYGWSTRLRIARESDIWLNQYERPDEILVASVGAP